MKHVAFGVAAVILLLAGSVIGVRMALRHGPRRSATSQGSLVAREFERRSGGNFQECTDESCLRAAAPECRRSHLLRASWTLEAEPLFLDYYVVPGGAGCRVIVIGDYSRVYYGSCKIGRRECPSVDAATSDDSDRSGCTAREILYVASPCERVTGLRALLRDLGG